MEKITVLLADDHTVVRQGLRALLEAEEDMNVVGEAENGRQAVQMAKRLQPDVVVMDIAMPSLNGLEATRQISRESPKSKVLILSSYSDDEYVQQLTDAGKQADKPIPQITIHPIGDARCEFCEGDNGVRVEFVQPHSIGQEPEQARLGRLQRIDFPGVPINYKTCPDTASDQSK